MAHSTATMERGSGVALWRQIADRIRRSLPTVTFHLNSAARKLGARNRVHAVTLATRLGII